jgi:hypothetical protein
MIGMEGRALPAGPELWRRLVPSLRLERQGGRPLKQYGKVTVANIPHINRYMNGTTHRLLFSSLFVQKIANRFSLMTLRMSSCAPPGRRSLHGLSGVM